MKKTIILGVGNPILGDDGVGLHVADELKKEIQDPDVEIDHAYTGGLNLVDMIMDHERAIIIDAIQNRDQKPGEVNILPLREISAFRSFNPHDVSFPQALKMAKKLGMMKRLPRDIKLVGINLGQNPSEFSEKLSKEINSAIPRAVELVKKEVNEQE